MSADPPDWVRRGVTSPRDLRFVEPFTALPLAGSEVLVTSHLAPVVLAMEADEPSIRFIVHPGLLGRPIFRDDGRWAAPYTPRALRAAPLRAAGPDDRHAWNGLAPLPGLSLQPGGAALVDADGAPTALARGLAAMVDFSADDRWRTVAEALFAADLLAPVLYRPGHDGAAPDLFLCRRDRLEALSGLALQRLCRAGAEPLELAYAMVFSQRWLKPEAAPAQARGAVSEEAGARALALASVDRAALDLAAIGPILDEGELFPDISGFSAFGEAG